MHTIAQLKDLLKKENIRLSKKRGQNFLVDKKYLKQITASCGVRKTDSVLEIGPGLGALTEPLSLACKRLIAVEFDKGLYFILKRNFANFKNVEIIHENILKYKLRSKFKVIGNLPYYIASAIIAYLIDNRKYVESAFVTVQKEVAERLIALPGRKSYGSLSCYVQFYCKPKVLINISRRAFYPQPAVESALLSLQFYKSPSIRVKDEGLFFKVIKAAFSKRRKTILNAMSSAGQLRLDKERIAKALSNSAVDPKRRGETLSLEEFARLTQEIDRL